MKKGKIKNERTVGGFTTKQCSTEAKPAKSITQKARQDDKKLKKTKKKSQKEKKKKRCGRFWVGMSR